MVARKSPLTLEPFTIVLGSHCLQDSELGAVKFVKKIEKICVVCDVKFKSTTQG